ncbi:MAG: NAD(P)H-hydrate dehydratase [Candidatus Pacebacteria bacterium]|nr:NAD(P)H-hydrate dehydratase [Candidatus Paceibacterota bacterium]
MEQNFDLKPFFENLNLPQDDSHKGQNGKLLIIGGSDLFHAASRWSLDVASKFVDMLFYSSTPENNQLIKEAKQNFWNGIVIEEKDRDSYAMEADVILIGPGMTRTDDTKQAIDELIKKFPDKKMVIDAGALQMVDPMLLNKNHIITPHKKEILTLVEKIPDNSIDQLLENGVTILLKSKVDEVVVRDHYYEIRGGNSGMTKGGTGDVLSGLVAAIYCKTDSLASAVVGSYINKKAGDALYEFVGPFFNSTDLVNAVPEVFWGEYKKFTGK